MKYLLRIILILLMIAPFSGASGQINFRKGWIITPEKDTIHGLVKEYGINRSMKVCRFKENNRSKPVNYTPDQILSYHIEDGSFYSAGDYFHKGELNRVFAEVLLDGNLTLSHYGKNKEMAYYLEMEEGFPVGLINKELNVDRKSDFGYYAYSNTTEVKIPVYRDTLFSLFYDSKKIRNQVANVKYTQASMISISKAYLNETCQGGNCITYEKDLRRIRDRFGIYSGLQTTWMEPKEGSLGYEYDISYPIGLYYNIPMPLINERFSVQFEMIYRRLISYEILDESGLLPDSPDAENMIGIPLLISYRILWNRFSPTLGAGKELSILQFSTQRGSWFADVGLDFELTPGVSLFTRIRLQRQIYRFKEDRNSTPPQIAEDQASYFTALHVGIKF